MARPWLHREVAQEVAQELEMTRGYLVDFGCQAPVKGRLARWLVEEAERRGNVSPAGLTVRQMYTHAEIAEMIGTSRQTVSQELAQLELDGLIMRNKSLNGTILILNLEALKARLD